MLQATLFVDPLLGAATALLLVGLPCVLLLLRHTREEQERHAGSEAELVLAAVQHRAELEDRNYADRLVTLGRMAAMAHELGTPLAVVQARAQMIAAIASSKPELLADAEAILQQTSRMTTMVRGVLAVANQQTQLKAPVDLEVLVAQTIAMIQPLVKQRNLTLTLSPTSTSAVTLGDASKLLQIITNLAMNAKQAMPTGGAITFQVGKRSVEPPRGGAEAEFVFVEVCDQGEGIPSENLPRIFDTYFTTKKAGEGSGLGLSISYQIADEHGGFIYVDSRQGLGSRFTLYLPPPFGMRSNEARAV